LTEFITCESFFDTVASEKLQRALVFYLTSEEALAAMASVADEKPELGSDLRVVRIDFSISALVETVP